MKTLTRPMFNMGGPIKQGVMHGIREPYKHGTRAALVGNPVYPKTGGREHHLVNIPIMGGIAGARWLATLGARKLAQKAAQKTFQNVGTTIGTGRNLPMVIKQPGWASRMGEKISGAIPGKVKSWFKADPLYGTIAGGTSAFGRGAQWTGKKLYGAAKYGVTTPSGLALTAAGTYGLWPDGTPKEPPTGIEKPGGYPKAEKKTKQAQADFAKAQREDRVQKYLKMMGYDRAKKTAIADALIDASKIVSDRGTLDRKNITAELINPIIQATSKRLDKPDQIREAVGLMATKAEIEKDLEDPSIKALRLEQLKGLRGGFSKDIGDFILSAKGQKIKPEALKRYARAKADQHGLDFTVVTDEMIAGAGEGASEDAIIQSVVKDDGVYMIGDAIVQVTGGVPKRIS